TAERRRVVRAASRGGHRSRALRRSKDLHELCLSVAVEPSHVRDPLDGLLLGVDLDDGETGYQLLRLQKRAVGDRDLAFGQVDPGLLGVKPAASDEDSLFDGLLHELPQLGRVPRLLPLRWGTVDKELHILSFREASAPAILPGTCLTACDLDHRQAASAP